MKRLMILIILVIVTCDSRHKEEIQGLWVIDPNSNYPEYMEFTILQDTIHFYFPESRFYHELILSKDSISIFGEKALFKIEDNKISTIYKDSLVNFLRPTIWQLEIRLDERRVFYSIDKLEISSSEKKAKKLEFLKNPKAVLELETIFEDEINAPVDSIK